LPVVKGGISLSGEEFVPFAEGHVVADIPFLVGEKFGSRVMHDRVSVVAAEECRLPGVKVEEVVINLGFAPAMVLFEKVIGGGFVPRDVSVGMQMRMMKSQRMAEFMQDRLLKKTIIRAFAYHQGGLVRILLQGPCANGRVTVVAFHCNAYLAVAVIDQFERQADKGLPSPEAEFYPYP